MDVAKELRRRRWNTILIFVTALSEYVYDAFDVGAFHYLVKPTKKAINKAPCSRALCTLTLYFQLPVPVDAGQNLLLTRPCQLRGDVPSFKQALQPAAVQLLLQQIPDLEREERRGSMVVYC